MLAIGGADNAAHHWHCRPHQVDGGAPHGRRRGLRRPGHSRQRDRLPRWCGHEAPDPRGPHVLCLRHRGRAQPGAGVHLRHPHEAEPFGHHILHGTALCSEPLAGGVPAEPPSGVARLRHRQRLGGVEEGPGAQPAHPGACRCLGHLCSRLQPAAVRIGAVAVCYARRLRRKLQQGCHHYALHLPRAREPSRWGLERRHAVCHCGEHCVLHWLQPPQGWRGQAQPASGRGQRP
mmetsp:Transcript_115102/g.320673  ORF Transcript_115102/g.320673 Transcript_115102/m.320673 type:complete len:233 (+) Transcript_115102:606-1304(+)